MTSAEIYAYAERNNVFHSDHGVCAGPRAMIEEFLNVLVDGRPVEGAESVVLDAPVQAALEDLDPAFDYGLYGLQAYAVVFSLWPMMSRTYEQLLAIVETWSGVTSDTLMAFRERLQRRVNFLRTEARLSTEEWREKPRAGVLGHVCAVCERARRTVPGRNTFGAHCPRTAGTMLDGLGSTSADCCGGGSVGSRPADSPELESLVGVLMDYFRREQAIVRAACDIQQLHQPPSRTPPAYAAFHRVRP